jgi:outer membrane receptor protein involved in Fe transport
MKTGAEIKFRDLSMQSIEQPDQPYTGEAQLPAGSPYADRGGIRDFYQYKPIEGAAYVQDKMEFEGLIVNAGLRGDFIIHDKKVIDQFTERLERDEPGAIVAKRGTYKISPRLGISHPITEQSKLYFNYGHFYQAPSFQYFYRSATANFEASSIIGNPNLEYEKTVQYELGVNTQISEFMVLDISGYYKDQYDLISTSDERWKNMTLDRYVNLDYGRMRGFELSIEKMPSHHYAFTFNYDFSYAYGKASDQHANRDARLIGVPYNWDEHPLNWDETHKIKAYVTVSYNKGEYPHLLGMTMPDDWMLTMQWEFGSGLPYTPSMYLVGIDNQNLVLPNSSRLPWHETTTLKFEKYYSVGRLGSNRLFFGFTIENFFNKRNVEAVYSQTGTSDKAVNPLNPEYNPFENRQDYDANPRNYGAPRNILFRIGMTF